jgi:tRNA-2-methylthio-N6-dimethylallyladenosine synthase
MLGATPDRLADPMRYWVEVYGCQMNVGDSEIIRGILDGAGLERAESPDRADAILVVTCAVREHAETRAMGRVTHLGGRRADGSKPVVAVCGCVAQEHGNALLRKYPLVDHVVGPDCYRDLPAILARSSRDASVDFSDEHYEGVEAARRTFPSAFVTIMRGCDNYCSYCIVPFVRGRERSRAADRITEEVVGLTADGFRDITLLGQNVNSYRTGSTGFPELLARVADSAGTAWIRFVTSHPRDFGDDLVSAMASHPNVCRHVHLPAQSGSSRILTLMNRGYDRDYYLGRIDALRTALPGVVITTDLIAGFPGESDEDFMETVELVKRVGFDQAFMFRYSEREGTRAAELGGALPVEVRLARLNILQDTQSSISRAKSAALAGLRMPVLVTGSGTRPGQQSARTAGNRVVILEGSGFEVGTFVEVEILSGDGWTHFADPVREFSPGSSPPALESTAG